MLKTASEIHMLFVRMIASPPLSAIAVDALRRRMIAGRLLACASDDELNASFVSLAVADEDLIAAVGGIVEKIGAPQAAGRAFRLEIAHRAAEAISDELLRAVAVDIHGALASSVYVARRGVPAARWAAQRPMGWGPDGLALGESAPTLPFGGSASTGVAIEAGAPTVIAKARIVGEIDSKRLNIIAQAVGGVESGFPDIAAYPIAARRDGSAVLVLEASDVKRTPLHRALKVLEIEAHRYGARLGAGQLLSDAPLGVFLDALTANMGLHVQPAQVIETHLPASAPPLS